MRDDGQQTQNVYRRIGLNQEDVVPFGLARRGLYFASALKDASKVTEQSAPPEFVDAQPEEEPKKRKILNGDW